ncbi:hypothetical protein J2Z48_003138 [Croceifilum oryzae]|uniref:Uncharacterized protein n=1 Tax=Croceifilum oryzae TaxID=1553429 RepID=A0AAJ1WUC1_9BACL|nr:hypothetical protein [Croceifilum oryzae]MDQ0418933.1 hypothetical protein [Croceifilum oryzae]
MIKTLYELDPNLFPEFEECKKINGESFDLYSLAGVKLDIEQMLLAGRILFPEFDEVDNMVFKNRIGLRDQVDHWREQGLSNWQIEAMLNHKHVHMSYVQGSVDADEHWLELGKLLKMCYEFSLSRLYPNKNFIVDLSEDDGPGDYVITFYQPEREKGHLEK